MRETTNTTRQAETEPRADIYQRITDRIAAAVEAGAGEWRMPWHSGVDGVAPVLPGNAVSGKPHRGVNTVILWAAAQVEGYPSAVWATYRQWRELGAQVRKGERSSPVVFWTISDKGGQDLADEGWRMAVDPACSRAAMRCSTRPRSMVTRPLPCLINPRSLIPRPSGSVTPRLSSPRSAPTSGMAAIAPATCRAHQDAAVRDVP